MAAERGANLVLAGGDLVRIFMDYPEALKGQFGSESLIAVWRFPLALGAGLLFLVWLRGKPAAAAQ